MTRGSGVCWWTLFRRPTLSQGYKTRREATMEMTHLVAIVQSRHSGSRECACGDGCLRQRWTRNVKEAYPISSRFGTQFSHLLASFWILLTSKPLWDIERVLGAAHHVRATSLDNDLC